MDESKKVIITAVAFFVIVALGISIYYFVIRKRSGEREGAGLVKERISFEEPAQKEKMLPEPLQVQLDSSDDLIRKLAGGLSSHPRLAAWLATPELIRKFVAAVDNIANGESPRRQVTFFNPREKFKVFKRKDLFYLDPESFKRYNIVADVFDSLDTEGTVRLYWQLKPAIQEAYRELGYPGEDFTDTLTRTIAELLRVPVLEEDIQLERSVVSFTLADPELEGMSRSQKHLLRMGPANVSLIQAKLREMAQELEIPASRLPR